MAKQNMEKKKIYREVASYNNKKFQKLSMI